MTRKIHYWSVKKGSIWWLASRVRAEEEQAVIRAVISPEML
jgi:phosphohistidine phosphatase